MNKYFTAEKITALYLSLMFTVFLLGFGTGGYTNISGTKIVIFYVLNGLYISCTAVSVFLRARRGEADSLFSVSPIQKPAYIFAALYLLFTIASAFLSDYFPITLPGASRYEGAVTICMYCTIFFLISQFARPTKTLFCIFAVSVTVFDTVCLLQLAGLNPFHLYPSGMNYYDAGVLYSGAYIGTIGNAGFTAAFLAASLPLFAFVAAQRKFPTFIFALPPLILSAIILIKCNILASLLGLAVAAVAAVPVLFGFTKKKVILYIGILLAVALIILLLIYFVDLGGELLHELHMILHGDLENKFGSSRIEIWKNVLGAIHEAPVLGKGPDTMIHEDFEPFSRYYPALDKTLVRKIDTAHNEYLNILYHQGFWGLIAYLGMLISVLSVFIKKHRTCKITAIFGICALCYAVQAFFGISVFMCATFFWICLGFICSDKKE